MRRFLDLALCGSSQCAPSDLEEARRDLDIRLLEGLATAAANVEAEKERAAIAESAAYPANAKATQLKLELDQLRQQLDQERAAHAATAARLDASHRQRTGLQAELNQARHATEEQRDRADRAIAAANERSAGVELPIPVDLTTCAGSI